MVTQTYQFNNKEVDVNLSQIPQFSDPSKKLLTQYWPDLPEPFSVPPKLLPTIHKLEKTETLLQETQDHATRDKILAFVKAAALAALIGAIVLVCLAYPPSASIVGFLGLELGFFAFALLSGLFGELAHMSMKKIDALRPEPPQLPWHSLFSFSSAVFLQALLGVGFIAPLVEVFTRESRIQNAIEEQKTAIDTMRSEAKTENKRILPIAQEYYQQKGAALLNHIEVSKIPLLQTALTARQDQPVRMETVEQELQKELETYQTVKRELQSVMAFYRQFDANTGQAIYLP